MDNPEPLSQPRLRLTEARNNRGLSQQEVADQIGSTHVNDSRWARGITRPSPYFRRKLCALFGKTALSITLAHNPEMRAYFSDGVLWADLGPNPNILGLRLSDVEVRLQISDPHVPVESHPKLPIETSVGGYPAFASLARDKSTGNETPMKTRHRDKRSCLCYYVYILIYGNESVSFAIL